MGGPKPKPTALKLLAGNPGRRPINREEPKPRNPLAPPADLSAAVRAEWDRLVAEAPPGLLTQCDLGIVKGYCVAMVARDEALKHVEEEGYVVRSPHSRFPIQSPWLAILNKQTELIMRLADHLGMSPAARTRIRTQAPASDDDEYRKFIQRDET